MAKRKRLTHHEVQNIFYKQGADGIGELIDGSLVSTYTLRRAFNEISEAPERLVSHDEVEGLRAYLTGRGFVLGPVERPDVGDVRTYKVQEARGRKFVRVPVDFLDLDAGDSVVVGFELNGFKGTVQQG